MFNFFNEIANKIKGVKAGFFDNFNIVNLSGKLVYIEGHMGLLTLSKENIVFRVKGGTLSIGGNEMVLEELSENTMLISGQIYKVESL